MEGAVLLLVEAHGRGRQRQKADVAGAHHGTVVASDDASLDRMRSVPTSHSVDRRRGRCGITHLLRMIRMIRRSGKCIPAIQELI